MTVRLMPEKRALSPSRLFQTGLDTLNYGGENSAGVRVDADTALSSTAIWACVRLLTSDISTLPLDAFRRDAGTRIPVRPKPTWIDTPDPFDPTITRIDHFAQVAMSLLLDGNVFVLVTPSVFDPVRLEVLNPLAVEVRKTGDFPTYRILDRNGQPSGETLTHAEVIHVPINRRPGQLRGMSPVRANSESIGLSLAADRFTARFFGAGAMVPGFVEVPGAVPDATLDDMARAMAKRHGGLRNSWKLGFLTGGAKYVPTGISPREADVIELRKYQLEEAARTYGIPPHKLQSQEPGAVGYASVEQRSIDYTETLTHYVEPLEAGYARLVPGTDTFLKFNIDKKLRADSKTRYEAYATGLQNKFLKIDEVRRLEDRPPFGGTDGDFLQTPNNNGPREAAPPPVTNNSMTIADGAIRSETTVEPAPPAAVTVENHVAPAAAPEVTIENRVEPAAAPAVTVENHVEPAAVSVHVPEQRATKKSIRRTDTGFELTEVPDGE